MPVFEYQGLNAQGSKVKGTVDADGARTARSKLKQQGIFPTALVESHEEASFSRKKFTFGLPKGKVSSQQLGVATRQLATLTGAGIPLVESLKALGEQLDQSALKRVFSEVCDQVNAGATLANALRIYPKFFPRLYVNMVASGEASGTLEIVLERLADLLEAQAELRRKILAAATYPILMLGLCLLVITILLAYVVPEITIIYKDRQAVLPLPTRVVIASSECIQSYWWLFAGFFCLLGLAFSRYTKTEAGRKRIDALKLRLPILGPLTLKVASARLGRTLGTMLASGVELLTALGIVKNVIGNVLLEEALKNAAEGVREGKGLAVGLKKSGIFPSLLIHMIAIGEQTGQLEQLLLRAAINYESEVNAFVSGFTRILEPVLILFLAGIVGGILASVMLPMLEMSSLAAS